MDGLIGFLKSSEFRVMFSSFNSTSMSAIMLCSSRSLRACKSTFMAPWPYLPACGPVRVRRLVGYLDLSRSARTPLLSMISRVFFGFLTTSGIHNTQKLERQLS